MVESRQIDLLVKRYVEDALRIVQAMKSILQVSDLLTAWRSNNIPAANTIKTPSFGEGTYRFHGRGCYFHFDTLKIDIELCHDPTVLGFDSWRLYLFAEETLGIKELDPEDIEAELEQRVANGTLAFSSEAPYFGLYYIPGSNTPSMTVLPP